MSWSSPSQREVRTAHLRHGVTLAIHKDMGSWGNNNTMEMTSVYGLRYAQGKFRDGRFLKADHIWCKTVFLQKFISCDQSCGERFSRNILSTHVQMICGVAQAEPEDQSLLLIIDTNRVRSIKRFSNAPRADQP